MRPLHARQPGVGQLPDHRPRPDPLLPALETLLPQRHRAYALGLLRDIVPSQRWGIGELRLDGWTIRFKGGWGSGTGRVDHQVALLQRGDERLAVAVLTKDNGTHAAGKQTLEGVFRRLLSGLQ